MHSCNCGQPQINECTGNTAVSRVVPRGAWWSYGRKPRCGPCPDCLGFQRTSAEKGSGGCGGIVRLLPERNWPCLSMRADPHLRVKAFSYRFVMPCRRHCSRLVRECISSGAPQCFLAKAPGETPRHALSFSLREAFIAGRCQKRNDFWVFGQGETEESRWGGGKKNKNALYRNPLDVSFFLPLHTNTIPLASVTGPAFLNSQPFFFFFLPACHSLCWKIRLSLQPGIKAQS